MSCLSHVFCQLTNRQRSNHGDCMSSAVRVLRGDTLRTGIARANYCSITVPARDYSPDAV